MARWEANATERLQGSAMTLFAERGYAAVTVAEIADRAGVTKRTFFNHFADKREVLFAGAQAFEADLVRHLNEAEVAVDPIDVAVAALTQTGMGLARWAEFARARRDLIASSPDLQERNLIKLASLAETVSTALRHRGVPSRLAALAAQASVSVFDVACDTWADEPTADFPTLMKRSLADLREAVGCRG